MMLERTIQNLVFYQSSIQDIQEALKIHLDERPAQIFHSHSFIPGVRSK